VALDEAAGVKGICRAIGDELRRARERKKASLADVAKKTKINPKYLQSIEEGEFDFLPEPYVRAFIRAYAQEVGLEPLTMLKPLDRVRERLRESKLATPVESPPWHLRFKSLEDRAKGVVSGRKTSVVLLLVSVVVIAALVILYAVNYEALFGSGKKVARSTVSPAPSAGGASTELQLELEAIADTWVQVVADDSTVGEGAHAAGARTTWKARHYFELKVSDPTAVALRLNGKPLPRLGDQKQEVIVRIERGGIVSRSTGERSIDRSPVDVEQYRGGLRRGDL
jgi:cytoskeletal protein RodZ